MVDASVPDIALEPDKAVKKVQDKLRLDLTDEEAVHYMQNLLDVSVTAVMAALVEQLHKFAQYWRKWSGIFMSGFVFSAESGAYFLHSFGTGFVEGWA